MCYRNWNRIDLNHTSHPWRELDSSWESFNSNTRITVQDLIVQKTESDRIRRIHGDSVPISVHVMIVKLSSWFNFVTRHRLIKTYRRPATDLWPLGRHNNGFTFVSADNNKVNAPWEPNCSFPLNCAKDISVHRFEQKNFPKFTRIAN